ncbi:TatA/E family twin arginine-targeting protein translocase [Cyanobium sp. T1B-Tous]|jgi:sec-independent protein translocase protein TatA|uniref:TatA/E family twin arginine-targeting protein translocase n=1 Tax=Cyanobium sp. T1B-Tous TaxID=2823721 RepID=UPI0020CC6E44|nr:TatA/E family twin arginine-targeting protein translocase [Cyanobium sp. T1B-Tous]MCP9805278.1 TatA/E family twin arginine-targeting protein translocase [Cyanobium sp. T1B-Tous]
MNVFGIGLPELAVIAAIGLLVFGPKRLPELGKTLGRTLKGFQSASSEFEKEFRSAITTLDVASTEASATPQAVMVSDQSLNDQPVADQPVADQPVSDQPMGAQPMEGQPVDGPVA